MVDPVAVLGFSRLRSLLQGEASAARAKLARRAAMSQDIERAALAKGFPAATRLAALAALARDVTGSSLPDRDRVDIAGEIDRLALRVLWHEGLLADSPHKPLPPIENAERLLVIASRGLLPEGAVGRMVLERARGLLRHHDSVTALQASADLRLRLVTLLDAAHRKVRTQRLRERVIPLTPSEA
jgi:hypothetical protein